MAPNERMSVGFIPKVAGELDDVARRTGLSKANVINRAVSVYAFVQGELEKGHELLVRDPETGEQRVVHII